MDLIRKIPVPDPGPAQRDVAAVWVWRLVREPFTAPTWRRTAYAVTALPMGMVCVPLGLAGLPTGRWQRGLARTLLGAAPARGSRSGLLHALVALPLNLVTAVVTLYGWSIVPMNLGWPLRAGGDPSDAWGGPTYSGAWAFHAIVGGLGFLLLMPWVVRTLTGLQLRWARTALA
ncbi:hypothetical protein EAO75_34650 [Streptomyces sp. uw30]|uniref:hypothetical protein n=1 Tax=Streptomyces sp. uw30 TaxID=1828179 RepID=UPI0011CEB332|nr:hypothetical protein [Streptomyces sp. uw30]TXS40152.1 hypothetical protein EAO75_34650 [Streptomyces sp. uw30]